MRGLHGAGKSRSPRHRLPRAGLTRAEPHVRTRGDPQERGGQAEYVMVPYAAFNLLTFPDRDQAMEKIRDLTMLSDIFPTGYHGAYTAGVTTGSTVYIAGAGPVGLACAASAQLLGAAVVIVGDMIPERLEQARSFGCETIELRQDAPLAHQIAEILREPDVDAAGDCVG